MEAACYVAKYFMNMKTFSIYFTSRMRSVILVLEHFLHFLVLHQVLSILFDADWGPQPQGMPHNQNQSWSRPHLPPDLCQPIILIYFEQSGFLNIRQSLQGVLLMLKYMLLMSALNLYTSLTVRLYKHTGK